MRYFIEFSYKGTNYSGWQKQNNAISVQQKLDEALTLILRETIESVGSSRTDTGVHAEQQYAHFDTIQPVKDCDVLTYRLNSLLPFDIAVHRVFVVEDTAHSRFDAIYRRYEYRIVKRKNPFLFNESHIFHKQLNIQLMNEAALLLFKYKNFESFSKLHTQVNNFLCEITEAEWFEKGGILIFSVKSNRFLRGMVRALVGTLLEVGTGKKSIGDFEKIIQAQDRSKAGAQAPAEGLFLVEVGYPE
ncbi:tRNA pseudouridine(38-40) synthase TruA [Dyadobacter subterraneus]|uniref:tRNA pseudouridine synthase A n=1 Tax=Dyadobacter subterraneus TaxID=2773304 RepID=A0ABR9WGM3_9BACT|nr:tRNA pseudouridine(38-40) synthase TruA [Dyadobacter subterraneus]MBE9464662.1 tRNA pseudouridine(38-40) synthase TruA [Dyadobacter subterraneus]